MSKTIKQAGEEFLSYLKAQGKADRTIYTYGKDLEQIVAFFGEQKQIDKLLPPHVSQFMKSDELLMKASKDGELLERAKPTVDKTIRLFRMLLIWAKEEGYISRVPLKDA